MGKFIKVEKNASPSLLDKSYNSTFLPIVAFIAMSAVNVISLATGGTFYSPFSLIAPYAILEYAIFMCGMYPPEYYAEIEPFTFWHEYFYNYMMILALAVIVAYVVIAILARKRNYKWLIVFMGIMVVDTMILYLHYGLSFGDTVIELFCRGYFIVAMILGVMTAKLYDKAKAEEERKAKQQSDGENADTLPLRAADMAQKHRILLEYRSENLHIVYRRVGKVNELVIDGMVYDEYIALAEFAHELKATISGQDISAGYNGLATSYININGKTVATKARII